MSAMAGVDDAEPVAFGIRNSPTAHGTASIVHDLTGRLAPSVTSLSTSDDCSAELSTARSRWTRGRSWTGLADRCTAIRVPTRSGGTRIVKSLLETENLTTS